MHPRTAGDRRWRCVGARHGPAEIAADRRQASYLRAADSARRVGERLQAVAHQRRRGHVGHGGQGPDPQLPVLYGNAAQFTDAVEGDQVACRLALPVKSRESVRCRRR